jgi:hypothetical protein
MSMEKKSTRRSLVIRKETLRTLSDDSLMAVAGGIKPETTPVSAAHCTGGGSCGTCHTPICPTLPTTTTTSIVIG